MIKPNIQLRNSPSGSAVLFFTLVSSVFGAGMFGVEVREEVFPVLGKGSDTKIAVGLTVGLYPKDATFSAVREKLACLPEADRLKIPEYLVMKEHELAARGDKQGILSLYATEKDKHFAANERWSDIDYSAAYIQENVLDYELKAKAKFGPYVHIKYKPTLKVGMSFTWSVVLKETEDGYLFSDLRDHIFVTAAQSFPHWQHAAVRNDAGDLSSFKLARFQHTEMNGSTSDESDSTGPALHVYYKLERFSEAASIDASQRQNIQSKLDDVLEGYKTGDLDRILRSWAPHVRNRTRQRLGDEISMNASTEYFKCMAKITPQYFVKSDDVLFLYATPIRLTGQREMSKLFRFTLQDGEYLLDGGEGKGDPSARFMLQRREFVVIVEGLLQAY